MKDFIAFVIGAMVTALIVLSCTIITNNTDCTIEVDKDLSPVIERKVADDLLMDTIKK